MSEHPSSLLYAALAELPLARLQRLAEALESNPEVELTVGSWRPRCPMLLAGFDPDYAPANAPERVVAAAWDAFACSQPRRRRRMPWCTTEVACRADVQFLTRCANAILAGRSRDVSRLDDGHDPGSLVGPWRRSTSSVKRQVQPSAAAPGVACWSAQAKTWSERSALECSASDEARSEPRITR